RDDDGQVDAEAIEGKEVGHVRSLLRFRSFRSAISCWIFRAFSAITERATMSATAHSRKRSGVGKSGSTQCPHFAPQARDTALNTIVCQSYPGWWSIMRCLLCAQTYTVRGMFPSSTNRTP